MSYRTSYRPSASLIHEIRMIAQSFFRHRSDTSLFARPKSAPLLCATCITLGYNEQPAVAVKNGTSVCRNHI